MMPPVPLRAACPVCPRWLPIAGGATVARHEPPGDDRDCPGSGQLATRTAVTEILVPPLEVAGLLAARRRVIGLTKAEVATAAGISANHYGLLEAGRSDPYLATLHRVCQPLALDLSFVGREDADRDRALARLRRRLAEAEETARWEREQARSHARRLADDRDAARADLARALDAHAAEVAGLQAQINHLERTVAAVKDRAETAELREARAERHTADARRQVRRAIAALDAIHATTPGREAAA